MLNRISPSGAPRAGFAIFEQRITFNDLTDAVGTQLFGVSRLDGNLLPLVAGIPVLPADTVFQILGADVQVPEPFATAGAETFDIDVGVTSEDEYVFENLGVSAADLTTLPNGQSVPSSTNIGEGLRQAIILGDGSSIGFNITFAVSLGFVNAATEGDLTLRILCAQLLPDPIRVA